MNMLVLPNIADENDKNRVTDELPQSGAGKTIMTTQPKFVPNEAVKITVDDKAELKIRMVDCVGSVSYTHLPECETTRKAAKNNA